ncbi:hypothetical protein [Nitriliruptor alkaliphilus]|uniref:hypothetical protein n=1 Tax=Nitriliruptor alkaliphilus TaxID=427918 RepID=UPI00069750E2|nr:hypothetical protein [Nitriliruptor alkaliphilus]
MEPDDAPGGAPSGLHLPDPWPGFDHACRERHGVADPELALAHGVAVQRFHDRTAREGWSRARPGIRLHPHVNDSVQQRLLVVTVSTGGLAAASRDTAAWLHGLQRYPPDRPSVAVVHSCRATSYRDVSVHRARWLTADDIVEVQRVPTLSIRAMLLSSVRAPADRQRARLIDVLHLGLVTPAEILALLDATGPVPGKDTLRRLCEELGPLLIESIFQDDVARTLAGLGYPAENSTHRIDTVDGMGLTCDVALLPWRIALEPEGDAFHRSRHQRRLDRRRIAAYAGTDWVPVPIDWRDWLEDRDHVLDAIDAAIAAQRRRGIGVDHLPPRRS